MHQQHWTIVGKGVSWTEDVSWTENEIDDTDQRTLTAGDRLPNASVHHPLNFIMDSQPGHASRSHYPHLSSDLFSPGDQEPNATAAHAQDG